MKKVNLLIVISLMVCLLCACGGGTAATITDKDGNTVQMTAKELKAVSDENSARFDDLYEGADIELTGTVESVSDDSVILKDGWKVMLSKSKHYDLLTSLNKGDKVYVKSNIRNATYTNVELVGMKGSIGYNDDTKKLRYAALSKHKKNM